MQDNSVVRPIESTHLFKLLHQEVECQKMKNKVDLLNEKFKKFECGEIKAEEFKEFVNNDIGIPSNLKFEKLLKTPNDSHNFRNILTSLDLLHKNEGSLIKEKTNPNYDNKHMRYKKVLSTPQSKEAEDTHHAEIKKFSAQLLKRTMTSNQYKEILIEKGINPNVEKINKVLRDHEVGKDVKFNELFGAVIKHKDEKFDPTKVTFEVKNKKFYKESMSDQNDTKSMVPCGNGTNQLIYFNKKRQVHMKYNSYCSNKEVFDWDLSTLNKYKTGEMNPLAKDNLKIKSLYGSSVFEDSPIKENLHAKKQNVNSTTGNTFFTGCGDIFTWRGNESQKGKPQREIKRRNPNEVQIEVKTEKKVGIANKMLFSSKENSLNLKA